jgi:carboxypeptidase A2
VRFPDATTGGTNDWAKGVAGVKHAICPELRGSSFIVPTTDIELSFQEIWDGIVAQEAAIVAQRQ